ncbi:MAG: hypothetical protein J7J52_04910 [Deltaproteobacteria bacterium]|nr:hypothetical protein [Deltaproteobacteria bacterium]
MKEFIVKLSDAEVKALEATILSIEQWLQDAITNKARQCIDRIILERTDRQPKKLSRDKKLKMIEEMELEVRSEVEKDPTSPLN